MREDTQQICGSAQELVRRLEEVFDRACGFLVGYAADALSHGASGSDNRKHCGVMRFTGQCIHLTMPATPSTAIIAPSGIFSVA